MEMTATVNKYIFPLLHLPRELIYSILGFVGGSDLARLCMVSHDLNQLIAQDQLVWKAAIYSELTTDPQMLSHESYKQFYRRAFLGQYGCLAAMVKPLLLQKFDSEAEGDIDCSARFVIEKNYPYGRYIKEQLQAKTWNNESDRQAHLCYYLCHAAKHGYEVWADTLCQQGAILSGVKSIPQSDDIPDIQAIYPLYFATRENNIAMVKALIQLGIRYHPHQPQYLYLIDERTSSRISSFHVTLRCVICKVLVYLRYHPHLLQSFLNSLNLSPFQQAAVDNNVDELTRLTRLQPGSLDTVDNYNLTPLMYAILLSRADAVRYIYASNVELITGYPLADSISSALGGIELNILKIIRHYDFECYEAVVFEAFGDEIFVTSSSNKDVLDYILVDLTNKGTFYAACQSAISARNSHLVHLLLSDLPTLLKQHIDCIDQVSNLTNKITNARKQVIDHYGKDLILDAAQFGQGNCIGELVKLGVRPNLRSIREMLYLGTGVELPSHLTIASNTKYNHLHQFILQLNDQNFDADTVVQSLQFYTFAKALANLPTNHAAKEIKPTVNHILSEIICRTMHSDWYQPMFIDDKLQQRLDQTSCALIENLMYLNTKFDINARDKSFGLWKETPLHVAAKLGNAAWVQLLLQAGADREIQDSFSKKPVDSVRKTATQCMHLLQNYNSCPLPIKIKRKAAANK